jgi:predicted esterase
MAAITDPVRCAADPSQTYALYLPSNYSPDRPWSVIFAFDPRARGLTAVERFQAAAEMYGYIVAGSNNSRNGSWESSMAAINAMSVDVGTRFAVENKRIYTAGMSGGARVALQVALGTGKIAGVIAASAGYPDSQPRKSVPFALFGTAGTEDFNYLEMRQLDRALTTPHRVVIFEGGHTWLSSGLAIEALEWMEIQAMKSGRRPRDEALVEKIFAKRAAQAGDDCLALESLVTDFEGLKDVSTLKAHVAALQRQKAVKDAVKKDRASLEREEGILAELLGFERGLGDPEHRAASLGLLRDRLTRLARQAQAPQDSLGRRMARRVLRGMMAGNFDRAKDPEYRKLLEELRPAAGPPRGP